MQQEKSDFFRRKIVLSQEYNILCCIKKNLIFTVRKNCLYSILQWKNHFAARKVWILQQENIVSLKKYIVVFCSKKKPFCNKKNLISAASKNLLDSRKQSLCIKKNLLARRRAAKIHFINNKQIQKILKNGFQALENAFLHSDNENIFKSKLRVIEVFK